MAKSEKKDSENNLSQNSDLNEKEKETKNE